MAYTPDLIATMSLLLPLLGITAVCLRFWVRFKVAPQRIWLDDWLIVFGATLTLGMGLAYFLGVVLGLDGRPHNSDPTSSPKARVNSKISYAVLVFEKPLYGAIKLSVLLFYRRVFTVRSFRIANNIVIALTVAWTIAFFIPNVLLCGTHPSLQWNQPKLCGTMYGIKNSPALNLSFGITDVVGDIVILSMPYPIIHKLHMSSRERWGVAGIFMLGWLSLAAGIARLAFVIIAHKIDEEALQAGQIIPAYEPPAFWTLLEVSVGVIAANLPPLGPLIRKTPKPSQVASATRRKSSSAIRSLKLNLFSQKRSDSIWTIPQETYATVTAPSDVAEVKAQGSESSTDPWPAGREDIRSSAMLREVDERVGNASHFQRQAKAQGDELV